MAGIELTVAGESFVQQALGEGLIISTHGNILRLLPPFIAGKSEIDQACATLPKMLTE